MLYYVEIYVHSCREKNVFLLLMDVSTYPYFFLCYFNDSSCIYNKHLMPFHQFFNYSSLLSTYDQLQMKTTRIFDIFLHTDFLIFFWWKKINFITINCKNNGCTLETFKRLRPLIINSHKSRLLIDLSRLICLIKILYWRTTPIFRCLECRLYHLFYWSVDSSVYSIRV